jgi:TolB-like protein
MLAVAASSPAYSKRAQEEIKDLAKKIASQVPKRKMMRIAVGSFRRLDGKPSHLGSYISEFLTTSLVQVGGLDVLERRHLDNALAEIKLNQSGLMETKNALHVGKMLHADAIVTGSITEFESYIELNCRVIAVETGQVFAAAPVDIENVDLKISATEHFIAQRKGSLLIEPKGCNFWQGLVDCDFLITNKGAGRRITLNVAASKLVNLDGNEFHPMQGILGEFSGHDSAATVAPSKKPVRARLSFDGIPPEMQQGALLLELQDRESYGLKFRPVPLRRP